MRSQVLAVHRFRLFSVFSGCLLSVMMMAASVCADETPQKLPFRQDWSDATLVVQDNDWSKAPGFMGYRGDKLAPKPGLSPQSITNDGRATPIIVLANQKDPNSLRVGGVAEFEAIPNPTIALKGSATATAPMLILNLETKGRRNITVSCKLRDLDAAANNAVQSVALQFRGSKNSAFTDVAAAFAPDVTTRPGVAVLLTPITVTLPGEADDQELLQVRWVTVNAEGDDEWVGIDDIAVTGEVIVVGGADKVTAPVSTAKPAIAPKEVGD